MCCDECKHYRWYYDRCEKWGCEVDAREVHNCFEKRVTVSQSCDRRNQQEGDSMYQLQTKANCGWISAYGGRATFRSIKDALKSYEMIKKESRICWITNV